MKSAGGDERGPGRRGRCLRAVLACVLAVVVGACGGSASLGPAWVRHPNGVRTFTPAGGIFGIPVGCPAITNDQIRGTLASSADRSADTVWLQGADGAIHVVWPDRWSFVFGDSGVTITSESGAVVATDGDEIVLRSPNPSDAAGTEADPYVGWGYIQARGVEFGCYLPPD